MVFLRDCEFFRDALSTYRGAATLAAPERQGHPLPTTDAATPLVVALRRALEQPCPDSDRAPG